MHQSELTEAERRVIELLRILGKQDPTFVFLPEVWIDRLAVMVDRGAKYNGNGTCVREQIFYNNDQSAFHQMVNPMNRLKNICPNQTTMIADADLFELPLDATNYGDMWLACRKQRQAGG